MGAAVHTWRTCVHDTALCANYASSSNVPGVLEKHACNDRCLCASPQWRRFVRHPEAPNPNVQTLIKMGSPLHGLHLNGVKNRCPEYTRGGVVSHVHPGVLM